MYVPKKITQGQNFLHGYIPLIPVTFANSGARRGRRAEGGGRRADATPSGLPGRVLQEATGHQPSGRGGHFKQCFQQAWEVDLSLEGPVRLHWTMAGGMPPLPCCCARSAASAARCSGPSLAPAKLSRRCAMSSLGAARGGAELAAEPAG